MYARVVHLSKYSVPVGFIRYSCYDITNWLNLQNIMTIIVQTNFIDNNFTTLDDRWGMNVV